MRTTRGAGVEVAQDTDSFTTQLPPHAVIIHVTMQSLYRGAAIPRCSCGCGSEPSPSDHHSSQGTDGVEVGVGTGERGGTALDERKRRSRTRVPAAATGTNGCLANGCLANGCQRLPRPPPPPVPQWRATLVEVHCMSMSMHTRPAGYTICTNGTVGAVKL